MVMNHAIESKTSPHKLQVSFQMFCWASPAQGIKSLKKHWHDLTHHVVQGLKDRKTSLKRKAASWPFMLRLGKNGKQCVSVIQNSHFGNKRSSVQRS